MATKKTVINGIPFEIKDGKIVCPKNLFEKMILSKTGKPATRTTLDVVESLEVGRTR